MDVRCLVAFWLPALPAYGLKVGTGAFVFDQRRPGACLPAERRSGLMAAALAGRADRGGPMFELLSAPDPAMIGVGGCPRERAVVSPYGRGRVASEVGGDP
jgi:hypothetical protein